MLVWSAVGVVEVEAGRLRYLFLSCKKWWLEIESLPAASPTMLPRRRQTRPRNRDPAGIKLAKRNCTPVSQMAHGSFVRQMRPKPDGALVVWVELDMVLIL